MKPGFAIPCVVSLGLCACEMINKPLETSGGFDPMRTPGSDLANMPGGPSYKPGEFVSAAMDNTGFYKTKPKGDAQADKLLPRGASMKVVSSSDGFLKVELDSGEIGFVPAVMVAAPGAAVSTDPFSADGTTQVYPPLDGGFPAPVPPLSNGDLPPDGMIPTVIDPSAPDTLPVPPSSTPVGSAPAPLPPNDEDLEKMKKDGNPAAPAPKIEADDPVPPVQPKLEGQ